MSDTGSASWASSFFTIFFGKSNRYGMIVHETATHQMTVEFKLLQAFNNETVTIPKRKLQKAPKYKMWNYK